MKFTAFALLTASACVQAQNWELTSSTTRICNRFFEADACGAGCVASEDEDCAKRVLVSQICGALTEPECPSSCSPAEDINAWLGEQRSAIAAGRDSPVGRRLMQATTRGTPRDDAMAVTTAATSADRTLFEVARFTCGRREASCSESADDFFADFCGVVTSMQQMAEQARGNARPQTTGTPVTTGTFCPQHHPIPFNIVSGKSNLNNKWCMTAKGEGLIKILKCDPKNEGQRWVLITVQVTNTEAFANWRIESPSTGLCMKSDGKLGMCERTDLFKSTSSKWGHQLTSSSVREPTCLITKGAAKKTVSSAKCLTNIGKKKKAAASPQVWTMTPLLEPFSA